MILFDKEIDIKTHYCKSFDKPLDEVDVPYINIQVKLNGCNANCLFCESKTGPKFNQDEYFYKLEKISKEVRIRKLNLTGGEPTLDFNLYRNILLETRKILPDVYLVTNTNGYNFEKIFEDDLYDQLDNIQLSRHHYEDDINNHILGTRSVSKKIIKEISRSLEDRRLLNLSCNLIHGYIDNEEEIFRYLEDSSEMNVEWVGFVSLIEINEYCKNNLIRFDDMKLEGNRFILTNKLSFKESCRCYSYFYLPLNKGFPLRVYNKQTKKSNERNTLTFNGDKFYIGYSEEVLI